MEEEIVERFQNTIQVLSSETHVFEERSEKHFAERKGESSVY